MLIFDGYGVKSAVAIADPDHRLHRLHTLVEDKITGIQFTSDAQEDVPIPDAAGSDESSITFGVLKLAQAMGDRQALLDEGRRVIRIHLGTDAAGGLEEIEEALR